MTSASATRPMPGTRNRYGFSYPDFDVEGRDWPNRSSSQFVESAGLAWHIQRKGEGPKLLLLHGTGGATHSFRDMLPLLAEHFDVLAPDLPGHGFTSPAPTERLSLNEMANALAKLLKQQDFMPELVAGHSAGAAILIRMALQKLITPRVIIGINAALMPFPGMAQKLFPSLARLFVLNPLVPRFFSWTASERAVERLLEGTGSRLDAAGNEFYRRLFAKSGHAHAALGMMARWELQPLIDALPRLSVPLHLIVGEKDAAVPPGDSRIIQKRLPGTTVTVLPKLGHLAHEEAPLQTVADIRAVWQRFADEPILRMP